MVIYAATGFKLPASRPLRKLMDSSRMAALGWVPEISLVDVYEQFLCGGSPSPRNGQ